MTLFELEAVGGPLARRLARRRGEPIDLEPLSPLRGSPAGERARAVWTQSAFSEYAAAASFAEIAACLFAAGAPLDLCAAAADFVLDEIVHVELCAQIAMALGGAVPLDVDLDKLVRPPTSDTSLSRVAEQVVRACCVGETLTVAVLQVSRRNAGSVPIEQTLARIVRDEAEHAELGWTFLDWLDDRVDPALLARAADDAIAAFAPIFGRDCREPDGLGVLSCESWDAAFRHALVTKVDEPLRARGIELDRRTLQKLQ